MPLRRQQNPGAGCAVVGWESPRATTLPPRRLRAALHPLRHPLELRCARLEPRPTPLTHAPAATSILPSYYLPALTTSPPACVLVHGLSSPLSLARFEPLRTAAMQGARATARYATTAFSPRTARAMRGRCARTQPAAHSAARHTCPRAYTHNMCSYDRNKARLGGIAAWTRPRRRSRSRPTRGTEQPQQPRLGG